MGHTFQNPVILGLIVMVRTELIAMVIIVQLGLIIVIRVLTIKHLVLVLLKELITAVILIQAKEVMVILLMVQGCRLGQLVQTAITEVIHQITPVQEESIRVALQEVVAIKELLLAELLREEQVAILDLHRLHMVVQ